MINPKLSTFLRNIKKNNTKRWYDDHKDEYKELRVEFTEQLESIRDQIATFDPAIKRGMKNGAKTVKVFRLHRDTRFSNNKQKYKTNISGLIAADVKNPGEPCYYFSIEPGGMSFIGGGIRTPERDLLNTMRDYIARGSNHKKLAKVLGNPTLKKTFPSGLNPETQFRLKTAPRGYDIDHPAIEYLRYQNFTIGRSITDNELKNPKLQQQLVKEFKVMAPVNEFLRKAGA